MGILYSDSLDWLLFKVPQRTRKQVVTFKTRCPQQQTLFTIYQDSSDVVHFLNQKQGWILLRIGILLQNENSLPRCDYVIANIGNRPNLWFAGQSNILILMTWDFSWWFFLKSTQSVRKLYKIMYITWTL